MKGLAARSLVVAAVVLTPFALAATRKSEVVAHEWGTFTTVAAQDGRAVTWIPLGGPIDLPCFVNVFGARTGGPLESLGGKVAFVVVRAADITGQIPPVAAPGSTTPAPASLPPILTYDQARAQLRGTVRMETPVIYFYSPRESNVNVRVDFPKGFISEWYPAAAVMQPLPRQIPLDSNLSGAVLWNNVTIMPGTSPTLLREAAASHYYAARETDASPIRVHGQFEKFLFYRGVGGFQVPIIATETSEGNIAVSNTGKQPLPTVILFENRDGRIGYRIHGALTDSAELQPVSLDGNIKGLYSDLEKLLVATGLYEREAKAMVETWRDSWFEEGTRLFYILPQAAVDEILPLSITPAPEKTARAFVGRVELITRETVRRVSHALDTENDAMLLRYGRFLGPITDRVLEGASPAAAEAAKRYVDGLFRSFVQHAETTCK